MGAGYMIARENFKEAGKHVSAEADPVMFNLLYGLQSLTSQLEADIAVLSSALASRPARLRAASPGKPSKPRKPAAKKTARRKAVKSG
jgi:hypothetical protein